MNKRLPIQPDHTTAPPKIIGEYGRFKVLGILGLFLAVCLLTGAFSSTFYSGFNLQNLLRNSSLFGIISVGVAFVIITGGIDLSIGSVIALIGCLLPWLLNERDWSVTNALLACLALSIFIGLAHGLLITKCQMLPFIATLCGLLLYRGIARGFTGDQTPGFQNRFENLRYLAVGVVPLPGIDGFGIPVPAIILLIVGITSALFLNRTVWGRYLLALGRNEQAARYSGIPTQRLIVLAYVISALLGGLGGVLFVLDVGSAQPSIHGNFYELWAIAAAVLGGCSLRGGEGSIFGVVLAAALLQVLRNAVPLIGIPERVDFVVVAVVLLVGVNADELIRTLAARRRAARQRAADLLV